MRKIITLAAVVSFSLAGSLGATAMERASNIEKTSRDELNRLLTTHIFMGRPLTSEVLAAANAERGRDERRIGEPASCSFVYEGTNRRKFMTCTAL